MEIYRITCIEKGEESIVYYPSYGISKEEAMKVALGLSPGVEVASIEKVDTQDLLDELEDNETSTEVIEMFKSINEEIKEDYEELGFILKNMKDECILCSRKNGNDVVALKVDKKKYRGVTKKIVTTMCVPCAAKHRDELEGKFLHYMEGKGFIGNEALIERIQKNLHDPRIANIFPGIGIEIGPQDFD